MEEAETLRLVAVTDKEIVFMRRPLKLFIEVPTATAKLPSIWGKPIYTLRLQKKQWSLDKQGFVKVNRWGVPLVPDFGGTAHAYCGTTMEGAMGDLLPWWKRNTPTC